MDQNLFNHSCQTNCVHNVDKRSIIVTPTSKGTNRRGRNFDLRLRWEDMGY
ncbi:unnamed protein product [Ectocarpus sp. CCAP 1310/34]|nr:unnamed protein product [Ectocarpus sp. CCAP 1310/34]